MTNFKTEADDAAANVAAIESEIRELEDRKQKFQSEAKTAREMEESAHSALGQAIADEDEARAETFRKEEADTSKKARGLAGAISVIEGRIRAAKAKLVDAKRKAEQCAMLAERSSAVEVVEAVKRQLADVLTALASKPHLFMEIGDAFSTAAKGRNPAHLLTKLDEIVVREKAFLERLGEPQKKYIPPGPPLLCDTAFFALAPFRFGDNGENTIRPIRGGFVGLVPAAVARRAVKAGVGQILAPPAKMVVLFGKQDVQCNLNGGWRVFYARGEYEIETELALRLAREGRLGKLLAPSPADMAAYHQLTVNRARKAPEIGLGIIRDGDEAEEETASNELPTPEQAPQSEASSKHARRQERARIRAAAAELGAALGSSGRRHHHDTEGMR